MKKNHYKILIFLLIILNLCGSILCKSRLKTDNFDEHYQKALNNPCLKLDKIIPSYQIKNDSQFQFEYISIDKLISTSDIIALVEPMNRFQETDAIRTKVKIKKIFKGNINKDYLTIIEPYTLYDYNFIITDPFYIPMQNNKSYYVFLNTFPSNNSYQYSHSAFSKYPLNTKPNLITVENTQEILYSDLKEYDLQLPLNFQSIIMENNQSIHHKYSEEDILFFSKIYLNLSDEINKTFPWQN